MSMTITQCIRNAKGFIPIVFLFSFLGCSSPIGSTMIWSIDKSGFVRPRDAYLNNHSITQADVVTISLNTLYLKYLKQEPDINNHLLVYTEVFDTPESNTPYRTVVYNEEHSSSDSILNFADRLIYGPVRYKGFPIRIKLYVVELDKKDNEFGAKVLQAVGSVAQSVAPVYSPIINAGMELGKILNAFNKDDFELKTEISFHYPRIDPKVSPATLSPEDLGVSESDPRSNYYPETGNYETMPLRAGHYLITKVEAAKRRLVDTVSKEKEYLAASSFEYDNVKGMEDGTYLLLFKGGVMWLDRISITKNSSGEEKWEPAGTYPYTEKTYVILSVDYGGKQAEEQKLRVISEEEGIMIQALLQEDQHEAILAGIANVGQNWAAAMRINGYEVYSQSGSLIPAADSVAYPFMGGMSMENRPMGIVVFGSLMSPLYATGQQQWALSWQLDADVKGGPDLEFFYGTAEGRMAGNVVYVVPEPGTLLLLACGGLGLLVLLWRRRAA